MPRIEDLKIEMVDSIVGEPCDITLATDCIALLQLADQSVCLREIIQRWRDGIGLDTDRTTSLLLFGLRLGWRLHAAVDEAEQLEQMFKEEQV